MTLETGIIVAVAVIAGIVWFLFGICICSKIDSFGIAMGAILMWAVVYLIALSVIIPLVCEEPEIICDCCGHICECGG